MLPDFQIGDEIKPYHELSQTIKTDLRNLENLYHERSALQAEKERFAQDRRETADNLLDARNDAPRSPDLH